MADTPGSNIDAFASTNQSILRLAKDAASVSSSFSKLNDLLSKNQVLKFNEQVKALLVSTGKFSKAQIAALQSFDKTIDVVKDLERSLDDLTDAVTGEVKSKKAIMKMNAKAEEAMAKAREAYAKASAAKNKAEMDAAKKIIKEIAKVRSAEADQLIASAKSLKSLVSALDKMDDKLTSSGLVIDRWAKDLDGTRKKMLEYGISAVSLSTSYNKLRDGITGIYKELSQISNAGLGGIYMQLKASKTLLAVSFEDMAKMITSNSRAINQLGGGAKGVQAFSDLLYKTRTSLTPMLGPELATKAAAANIETLQRVGVSLKNLSEFEDMTEDMNKNFLKMAGLFHDSNEEFQRHTAVLFESEEVQMRLNSLGVKEQNQLIKEMMIRDRNLRILGLTNQEIENFNQKLYDTYDPRKQDAAKTMTDIVKSEARLGMMISSLKQQGNFGDAAELEKNSGLYRQYYQNKARGLAGAEDNKKLIEQYGEQFASMGKAEASMYSKGNVFTWAPMNSLSNSLSDELSGVTGKLASANRSGKMLSKDQADSLTKQSEETITPSKLFQNVRNAAQYIDNILQDSFTKFAQGVLSLVGGLLIATKGLSIFGTGASWLMKTLGFGAGAAAGGAATGAGAGAAAAAGGAGVASGAATGTATGSAALGLGGAAIATGGLAVAGGAMVGLKALNDSRLADKVQMGKELAEEKAVEARLLDMQKKNPENFQIEQAIQKSRARQAQLQQYAGSSESTAATAVSIPTAEFGNEARSRGSMVSASPASSAVGSSVVSAVPNSTTVRNADGSIEKRTGARNWRNNNPGNLEYNDYTKSLGAIGTDGRFAVFPSYDVGRKAKETMIFSGKNYKDLNLTDAISRYAPAFENNTSGYQNSVLSSVGGVNKKMSDYTAEERQKIMDAMQRVEGYKVGTINKLTTDGAVASTSPGENPVLSENKKQTDILSSISQGINKLANRVGGKTATLLESAQPAGESTS